ncbi:MAG: pyrimidine/purine nucleoside phosphorylase [Halanaeroarchaeum sp.]
MPDDHLKDVTVRKEANVYYEGHVTSRELETADGDRKTLGIVLPGEYEFETDEREDIEIVEGRGRFELPTGETISFEAGDVASIPSDTTFTFVADSVVDYYCSYGE